MATKATKENGVKSSTSGFILVADFGRINVIYCLSKRLIFPNLPIRICRSINLFFEYLLLFQRYSSFCSKSNDGKWYQQKKSITKSRTSREILDAVQTCLQYCTPGENQNYTHFNVTMVLLSAPVLFCYEPIISIFNQIRRGKQSYLKHTKYTYFPTSSRLLIGSKRCLIKTKK